MSRIQGRRAAVPESTPIQYLWELTRGARGGLLAAIVLSLGTSIITIFQPRILQNVVNEASAGAVRVDSLTTLAVLVVGASLVTSLGSYFGGISAERISRTLRERISGRLLSMTIREADKTNSADLLARSTSDSMVVRGMIMGGLLPTLGSVVMLVGIAYFMILMDAFLFGVTVGVVCLGFTLVMLVGKTVKRSSRELQEATGAFSVAMERMLASLRTIKAFNAQRMEYANVGKESTTLWRAGITLVRLQSFIQPALNLCLQGAFVAVILTGSLRLSQGTLTIGGLMAYLMYLFLLVNPIASLGGSYTQIQIGLGALGRLRELDGLDSEDYAAGHPVTLAPYRFAEPPLLEFRDVWFAYEPGTPTLRDVSLTIRRGEHVCVVGRSGSGKSTLIELIERFYEPDHGRILLDGQDIRFLDLGSYRARFALVGQGGDVLTGTLRDNLTLGDARHSEERLWEVLDMVGLRELVGRGEFTLDTDLGQHGITLSGGQRQRIAWARALLSDADILLLDEPTANLDPVTERAVRRLVQGLGGKTVITVTHQLDSVTEADSVIVIEDGRLVAQGSHEQLISSSPTYRALATPGPRLVA